MKPSELYNRLQNLDINHILAEMVEANEDYVVFLNQKQLLKGEKKDGSKIGTYRPYTIMRRMEKGRQTAFIDLFYEGDFQEGMFVEVRGLDFLLSSKDSKTDKLEDLYGENIFGLSAESKRMLMTEKGITFMARRISNLTGIKTKAA